MELNMRMIRAKEFLKTAPSGELDLETSKRVLLKLALKSSAPSQYDILIDLRGATSFLSIFDVAKLVQVMIEHRESFRSKLAILTIPGHRFDIAKFMEMCAEYRGFDVAAFKDFEEAMNWLMTSTELSDAEPHRSRGPMA